MQLTLLRKTFTTETTIGELFLDEVFECYILEDRIRAPGLKVKGKTAIPAGIYRVTLTMSKRFRRVLPILLSVENYEGIRIHPGNKAVDTDGCLLPGTEVAANMVLNSRVAFTRLFGKLWAAQLAGDPIWIEIRNIQPPAELLAA